MANEPQKARLRLEIAHVLFIDIVGYSKQLTTEQAALLRKLTDLVRQTEEFRRAERSGQLVRVPTGDGMALVFRESPEAPVQCALELSGSLKEHPELQVRMGIHSGPVNEVADVNERTNVAGAGINIAQRVMDCGDAGHILLSKHVADDLQQYPDWRPMLHELGECEVKHGFRLSIVNLYTDELGNSAVPEKFNPRSESPAPSLVSTKATRFPWHEVVIALLLVAALIAGLLLFVHRPRTREIAATSIAVPAVPAKSVAVLPFENLSSDPDNVFFTDGMQDEILTHLARLTDLKVISRTSVMQYKSGVGRNLRKIGEELGVAHVVEGAVQRVANRVRVNAQLIDARDDAHLWGQSYDRELADVFAIQSEIARAIAEQLEAKLSPSEKAAIEKPPTTNLAAFDLYSRAKTLLLTTSLSTTAEQNLRQAVELFDQAVRRDPAFFEAFCQLAYAHEVLYGLGFDHTPARLGLAETALQAAIRLRPDAGETHLARAQYLYFGPRDYEGALAELEIAGRSLANEPRIFELTGYIVRRRGQREEGVRILERATELDPRNFFTLQQIAQSYQALRRYPQQMAVLDRALTIIPNDAATKTARALVDFYWKAETRPLYETIDSILAENPGAISEAADGWFLCALAERDPTAGERALVALGDNPCFGDNAILLSRSFGEGLLARMMKDEAKARAAFTTARGEQEKIIQAQPDYGPPLCVLGLIDAALGRKEDALREGRRAIELLPVEKDRILGEQMLVYFAIIGAWTGEKDLAIPHLATGAQSPAGYIVASYGGLKLLPFWDPLRGDPRFEKIVASLAPK